MRSFPSNPNFFNKKPSNFRRADSKHIPNLFAQAPEKEITTPHELDDDPEEDPASGSSSASSSAN